MGDYKYFYSENREKGALIIKKKYQIKKELFKKTVMKKNDYTKSRHI